MGIAGLADLIADSGASAPAAFSKASEPGDMVVGTVTSVRTRQRRDAKTKKPMWWEADEPGGERRPQVQVVITLDTGIETTVEETGEVTTERSIFLKSWGDTWKSFTASLRKAGLTDLDEGVRLQVTYLKDIPPTDRAMDPTKVYGFNVNGQITDKPVDVESDSVTAK